MTCDPHTHTWIHTDHSAGCRSVAADVRKSVVQAFCMPQFRLQRHFGFLVHDNIFEVDSDTLNRSLNFIANEASKLSGQYILTLNSDRASADAADAMKELSSCVRASFTKDNRFLGRRYQEK